MRFLSKTSIGVGLAMFFGLALTLSAPALADRASSIFDLVMKLNGSPSSPANITTATGADADSTAVAKGSCLMIQCTTDTYVLEGTTVAASGSTRGILLLADAPPFQLCLSSTGTQFSTLARSSAGTCGYWVMK